MDYNKLLDSYEWKQKRSKVLERDKCCQNCGSYSNLNVHHIFYFPNRHPAQYSDSLLITLCGTCHKSEHYFQSLTESGLKYMREMGLSSHKIWNMLFKDLEDEDFINFHKAIIKIKNESK